LLALLGPSALATRAQAAELPVKRVVLYKHGIGFFERQGQIPAGESAEFLFKADEMNDVLKSLTVTSAGAPVAGVRYDSSDPLSKKLGDFPFHIGEAQPLSRLLDQFKGSRIHLRMTGGDIEGTIISSLATPATNEQPERHQLVLLMDNGEMRNVDPGAAAALSFVDPKIQQQFRDYLMLVAGSRNLDKRRVTIESAATQARSLVARYVVPTPVWKSSYRLVFDEQTNPLIEGWAIVDNTTGEDWTGVTLSLVSGMPVSFITQLYEPRYVSRPIAELPGDRAQRPIIHAGAVGGVMAPESQVAAASPAPAEFAKAMARRDQSAMMEMRSADEAVRLEQEMPLSSTLAAGAAAGDLGDLFEYRIDRPVTVRQGESAMLPFLQQRINGRKLLIFSESYGSQHPLNAVELTNSSSNTLDGGAVTIFDAGAYAGEALFETIKSGDKRLVSYAVDLGARITTAFDSSSKMLRDFTLRRGVLTFRQSVKEVRTYTIHNVDQKEKTVIIERPVRPGYDVIEPKPTEKTADSQRYEVKVAAGATAKFPVTEERVITQAFAITNLTDDQLLTYVQNTELNEAGRAKLQQIADLKRQIAVADQETQRLEQQIQERSQDQDRLRRNISSLNSVAGQQQQVQEYAKQLSAQEVEMAGMRDRQAEVRRQRDDLQQKLNALIETLVI
jgi:hypothetical protein